MAPATPDAGPVDVSTLQSMLGLVKTWSDRWQREDRPTLSGGAPRAVEQAVRAQVWEAHAGRRAPCALH